MYYIGIYAYAELNHNLELYFQFNATNSKKKSEFPSRWGSSTAATCRMGHFFPKSHILHVVAALDPSLTSLFYWYFWIFSRFSKHTPPNSTNFQVHIFPYSNAWKYGPEKTLCLDTSHAVCLALWDCPVRL